MGKLLSIVINISNDDYYKDLIFRTQKALDFNLIYLKKINKEKLVEFIFVDWGSKKKLSDIIIVNKEFRNIVKFIYVDKKNCNKKFKKLS